MNTPFIRLFDIYGTYDEVASIVNQYHLNAPLVREDPFTRNEKEVHRVYFRSEEDYLAVATPIAKKLFDSTLVKPPNNCSRDPWEEQPEAIQYAYRNLTQK